MFLKIEKLLKIAYHKVYNHPLPERHRFPMLKYDLIAEQLQYEGLVTADNFFAPDLLRYETACLAHKPSYVNAVFNLQLDPKMVRRLGFPLSEELLIRERCLVDGTLQSALYALEYGVSFNVAGGTHHAGYDYAEGFCLLNDQAIAAAYLIAQQRAKKILIIDLDVHQGNGTAHIFLARPDVFTFSMHGEKNFPFIKERSDLDVPLPDGIDDAAYLARLATHLPDLFTRLQPDFVFYQAGVDILETDKLGKLKLTPQGCKQRDRMLLQACRDRDIPVQVSMGGGYSPNIKHIVNAHVETYRAAIDIFDF
ncbi:histone deacetylase [Sphingobacterium sp. Mn56C]|uniref:histone deacetylase family protein n=1 Tax=Sphingobacterium sp. Mn56C TaxID=3395261 RepID=UPI003BDD1526